MWTELAKPSVEAPEDECNRSLERKEVIVLRYPSPVVTMEVIPIALFLRGLLPDEELHIWNKDSELPVATTPSSKPPSDCTICPSVVIGSVAELRAHFKTAWHLHNLRARQSDDPALSESEFVALAVDDSTSSSPCSSADEDERDEGNIHTTPGTPMIRFYRSPSAAGNCRAIYEVYKSVVYNSGEHLGRQDIDHGSFKLRLRLASVVESTWLILLIRSGRVACATFDNQSGRMLQSKTFKRYTVRRKQGGSQLARDAAGSGRVKSAGASIRRRNELHLIEDIQQLLVEWRLGVGRCSRVFWNPTVTGRLCLAESSVLCPSDDRLWSIPFTTYQPSLEEVQRCYRKLSGVHCVRQAGA